MAELKFCTGCGEVIPPGHVGPLDDAPVDGFCSEFCREVKAEADALEAEPE